AAARCRPPRRGRWPGWGRHCHSALRGALNTNMYFHSLVLDGVFTRPLATAAPVFQALPPPTDDEIAEVLGHIHRRARSLLRRRGASWPMGRTPPTFFAARLRTSIRS